MQSADVPSPSEPVSAPARRSRLRVWAQRVLLTGAGLVLTLVLALSFVLHSFDRPWLKSRLVEAAHTRAGLDLDYRGLEIGAHGMHLLDLAVQSPSELRAFAPVLVHVGRVDVGWSLRRLLSRAPTIDRVSVADVDVTIVVDEHGRTSFDALAPPAPTVPAGPQAVSTPLSRLAASVLHAPLPLGSLELLRVRAAIVRTTEGSVRERAVLTGFEARATTNRQPELGSVINLDLGTQVSPLALDLVRAVENVETHARGALWLQVALSSSVLTVAVDARVAEQSFAPTVDTDHWLHAELTARFDGPGSRTVVTIDKALAGDGSVTAAGVVDIQDDGEILVRHAAGHVDGARVLAWLPAGLVPLALERGDLRYEVSSLVAGAHPRLKDGGIASADAEVARLALHLPDGPVTLDRATVSLKALPDPDGALSLHGSIKAGRLEVATRAAHVVADDIELDVLGGRRDDGSIDGRADVRAARLAVHSESPITLYNDHVDIAVKGLVPGPLGLLSTRGDVTIASEVGALEAHMAAAEMRIGGLRLRGHTVLTGHAPYAVDIDAPMEHLHFVEEGGRVLADSTARIQGSLRNAVIDGERPRASPCVAHLAVDLGDLNAVLDLTKRTDDADYDVHASTPSLSVARPWIPRAALGEAPWDRIGVALTSSGHIEGMFHAPKIHHTSEIAIERGAFGDLSAAKVVLNIESRGDAVHHEGKGEIHTSRLVWPGLVAADDHATFAFSLDRERRAFEAAVDVLGRAVVSVHAKASFDAEARAIPYEVEAHLSKLASVAPLLGAVPALAGFDVSSLALALSSRGILSGVIGAIGRDGVVVLDGHPSASAVLVGSADLALDGFRWSRGDTSLAASKATWHGDFSGEVAKRKLDSHLEVGALHVGVGPKSADLRQLVDNATIAVGDDLTDPTLEVKDRVSLASAEQDFVPGYPVGELTLGVAAECVHDGILHRADLKLVNLASGTTLDLSGNLELAAFRRKLSMTVALGQDLGRLSGAPERFLGHGQAGLDATVTSPDLATFRVRATVKARDVSLKLPRAAVEVEGANGEIPITVALAVGKNGVELRPDDARSVYSMLRFADQHPLLTRSGFLSVTSLKTRFATIAPLVGNVAIERNVISLRQFEVGVRQGTITGQLAVAWDGPKSTAELHVRATGVRSSHGEPFDGNVAVVVSAADRTVEGRADVLRIGQRHLLDLLDLADASRTDPGMNRIRSALGFGYPDRLRLSFDHGFANARLELGGLARMITIGELRGIPMGPIIDSMLASATDPKAAQ